MQRFPRLLGTRRFTIETDDLADLTRIDHASEVDPRKAGLSAESVAMIWAGMEDLCRTGIYPALTFCLRREGEIVLNRAIGYARGLAPERPLAPHARRAEPDTPSCIFSASKAVTGLLIHKLAEEGGIDLQMLLDGGVYNGRRLFEPSTVARAIAPATGPGFDRRLKIPMRYTEGLILGMNPVGLYGPMCGSAYGHPGFMNILGWADPSRGISAGLMTTGKAILGGHLMQYLRSLGTLNHQCRRT